MARVHLNWSGCRDWHAARARLPFLKATLYGNFAYAEGEPSKIKKELEDRGFIVSVETPDRYEDARYILYGVNG